MKKFDLLPEIQSIHPEGIAEGERCGKPFNVLLGLPRHWQVEDLVNACERRWQPARVDIWYNLDLQGIAVVTPSVTRILIGATTEIALELKKPVSRPDKRAEVCLREPGDRSVARQVTALLDSRRRWRGTRSRENFAIATTHPGSDG